MAGCHDHPLTHLGSKARRHALHGDLGPDTGQKDQIHRAIMVAPGSIDNMKNTGDAMELWQIRVQFDAGPGASN